MKKVYEGGQIWFGWLIGVVNRGLVIFQNGGLEKKKD